MKICGVDSAVWKPSRFLQQKGLFAALILAFFCGPMSSGMALSFEKKAEIAVSHVVFSVPNESDHSMGFPGVFDVIRDASAGAFFVYEDNAWNVCIGKLDSDGLHSICTFPWPGVPDVYYRPYRQSSFDVFPMDGHLYVGTFSDADPVSAQQRRGWAGKVVRLERLDHDAKKLNRLADIKVLEKPDFPNMYVGLRRGLSCTSVTDAHPTSLLPLKSGKFLFVLQYNEEHFDLGKLGDSAATDYEKHFSTVLSTDGHVGPYQQIELPGKRSTESPFRYAVDGNGVGHIAWSESAGRRMRVCYSRLDTPDSRWRPQEVVWQSSLLKEKSEIVSVLLQHREGVPCIVWSLDKGGTFSSARIGEKWSPPVEVRGSSIATGLDPSGKGGFRVVLDTPDGMMVSDGDGRNWSECVPLGINLTECRLATCRDGSPLKVRSATTDDGSVHVVWLEWPEPGDAATIRYAYFIQTNN